ncbi:MAG: ketopantoate reductase family protein [SAR202 cluster bacterium]|nr:ketopantoate reductase family protein [SAR202 cluster bacterium]|tara:strand:- start:36095 stop:37114 length:1020 start_codon:yes stop_codon:yes gene_type:complete
MKIGIMGAGAIGGLIGGYLKQANFDVTLIDSWYENISTINNSGLKITSVEDIFEIHPKALHIGEVSTHAPLFDFVILSVKSYDTEWATAFIKRFLKKDGFIVSAQNGINEDKIKSVTGQNNVLGCVITLGAAMESPGHAKRTTTIKKPAFALGEIDGSNTDRVNKLTQIFSNVGISRVTENLLGERWSKLVTNCMSNPICSLTGLTSEQVRINKISRQVSINIATEIISIGFEKGIQIEKIVGIDPNLFLTANESKQNFSMLEEKIINGAKTFGSGKPSMSQDIVKSRKTEINELNGYVLKLSQNTKTNPVTNAAIVELIKKLEKREINPTINNLNELI